MAQREPGSLKLGPTVKKFARGSAMTESSGFEVKPTEFKSRLDLLPVLRPWANDYT